MQSNQDLNQNGIPDRLEAQQGFGFVGSVPATSVSVVDVREAPTLVERIEKPAVVHEVYKTEEITQVQPIINREREQLDVYEVVQPMKEREVIATEVREAVLPAQTRATIVEDNSAYLAQRSAPSDFSTREVAATQTQVIQNAPIVHETINHRVIEEIQPVIYKEVDRPVLVKETLPIYEKVVEAPHSHHTVLPMRDLGVSSSTTSSFTTSTARVSAPMVTPVAAPIATPAAASYNAPTPVPVQSGLLYNSNILPGYSTTMVSSGSGMQQPLIRGDQLGYAPHNEEFLRMYGTTPSTALPQQQATKGTELNADNDLSRRLQAAMLNANTRI